MRLRIIPIEQPFDLPSASITLAEFEAFLAWMKTDSKPGPQNRRGHMRHAMPPSQPFQRGCQRLEWFSPVYAR